MSSRLRKNAPRSNGLVPKPVGQPENVNVPLRLSHTHRLIQRLVPPNRVHHHLRASAVRQLGHCIDRRFARYVYGIVDAEGNPLRTTVSVGFDGDDARLRPAVAGRSRGTVPRSPARSRRRSCRVMGGSLRPAKITVPSCCAIINSATGRSSGSSTMKCGETAW